MAIPESELKIDDGTQVASVKILCSSCETYLKYPSDEEPESVRTDKVRASEYTFSCPTPGCGAGVVLRLVHPPTA